MIHFFIIELNKFIYVIIVPSFALVILIFLGLNDAL